MTHNKHYYYTRIDNNNIGTIITGCSKKQLKNASINTHHKWVRFSYKKLAQAYITESSGTFIHDIDVTNFNY